MPDAALAVPSPMTGPALLTPLDGAPVDGSAATFAWDPLPDALGYRLQVADDDAFEQVRCEVETGQSTLLTLYAMLPEDGATLFWRVQAQTTVGWQPWSPPARLTAATDLAVRSFAAQQEPAGGARPRPSSATPAPTPEDAPPAEAAPYQYEQTSARAMLLFLGIMLVSFAVLLVLNVRIVAQMQAERAAVPVVRAAPPPAVDQAMDAMLEEAPAPQNLRLPE